MKLCLSSSGCETRPVRGEPTHTGSEPGGGRGSGVVDAEARKRVGRRSGSHEITLILGAQGFVQPEGHGGLDASGRAEMRTQRGLRLRHAGRGRPGNLGGPHFSLMVTG